MRETYLSERIYRDTEYDSDKQEVRKQYWTQLLGEKTVDELLKHQPSFYCYLQDETYDRKEKAKDSFLKIDYREWDKTRIEINREVKGKKIFFAEFYQTFLVQGREQLKRRIELWKDRIGGDVINNFSDELNVRLQEIALRTLIAEMHAYKQNGQLCGCDSAEEYQYFCRISGTKEFFIHISDTYPVLLRCLKERIEEMVRYYEQVIRWEEVDRKQIEELFFDGADPGKILAIESGLSDLHNHGKEVMKIRFEHGDRILLKPRSMRNEQFFSRLLKWIGDRTGTDQYRYPILSCQDHSWCGIVEYQSCDSEDALHRYYQRLGEQLLLAYLLGTNDIHYENLIACGEYPVIIDLEALTHNSGQKEDQTAEDAVRSWIGGSVLSTGILPTYTWNGDGEGIDGSALHSRKGQTLPFKIPAVDKGETSEMYITYRKGYSSEGKNIAGTKDGSGNLAMYGEDILSGFSRAYKVVEQEKDSFLQKLEEGKEIKSRIVLMHTQRYSMLLSSSYHPSLLMDGADREIFLSSIGQGRRGQEEAVVEEEINSLLTGNIPSFSFAMEQTDVCCADGKICEQDYFQKSALRLIRDRINRMCDKDLIMQGDLIRTSVDLIPENRESFSNNIYPVEEWDVVRDEHAQSRMKAKVAELTARVCDYAIWNPQKTEVSWFALRFSGSGKYSWEIRPMGIYFYDGLSGMLLLSETIKKTGADNRIAETCDALKQQIFQYTDKVLKLREHLQSRFTGAYTGEGSLVYVYLRLYQMTGKEEYLRYAKKHAELVYDILPEDRCADLLGGKAGAAWVFLQMYEETKESRYVEMACKAIAYLVPQAVKAGPGIGWIPENCEIPVGGMAHGNAGILMPVLELMEITGKKEYGGLAEKIWEYENSLYNLTMKNWADVREGHGDGEDTVAWCHGAAGILLSRVWCYERITDQKWRERLRQDIDLAYQKTKDYWKRDSWSLCHGNSGNLWILELAEQSLWKKNLKRGNFVDIRLLPQERMNPGIMGGYGGVLLYLAHHILG